MKPAISVLVVIVALVGGGPVHGQPAEAIRYYRDAYRTVANNYRAAIRSLLAPQERRLVDQISFEFVPTQDIFAQAYISTNNRHVVEVSFGFLAFMQNLTFAYAVTGEANQPACYVQYLDVAARAALDNTKRRTIGQAPGPIPFFPYYVQIGGEGCHSISSNDLYNPEAHSFVSGGMDAVLAVLIGHEVAHHILGHVDGGGPIDLEESRESETAADVWAVEHAFAIRVNPSPALPIWSFFAAIGGADIGDELEATHPLGIRRWADALDQIVRRMQSPDYAERFGESPAEWELNEISKLRDQVRQLVP